MILVVVLHKDHKYRVETWMSDGAKVCSILEEGYELFHHAVDEAVRRAKEAGTFAFQDSSHFLANGATLSCLWPAFRSPKEEQR